MANVQEVSDANFQTEVLDSPVPVLVDFWAPWCGPCRMLTPIVEQLAAENAGSLKVTKVNVDDSPRVSMDYGISAVPTVMIFKDGELFERFIGVQPKQRLQAAVDQAKA